MWGVCGCVWDVCGVGVCVGGGGWVCVCLAYTSEDFHMKTHRYTEDSTRSEDPKTGPRKTLAKNAKNVMFYHLRGVRAPRTSTDFQPYLIYEDIRVLGSISKASGCVCVCVCVIAPPDWPRGTLLWGSGLESFFLLLHTITNPYTVHEKRGHLS